LTGALERMTRVLDVALLAEFLEPGEPFLHGFLHFLAGLLGRVTAAKQKGKFAHCVSSRLVRSLDVRARGQRTTFSIAARKSSQPGRSGTPGRTLHGTVNPDFAPAARGLHPGLR